MSEQYFRHLDGGLYRFVAHARSADTTADVVVYEHLWPFEQSLWVRDRKEFEERFTSIDEATLHQALNRNRTEAQAEVTSAKASRRARKES